MKNQKIKNSLYPNIALALHNRPIKRNSPKQHPRPQEAMVVSCILHNVLDTASYTKPLRFQIDLATFLDFTEKHLRKYDRWEILQEHLGVKTRKWQNWLKWPL